MHARGRDRGELDIGALRRRGTAWRPQEHSGGRRGERPVFWGQSQKPQGYSVSQAARQAICKRRVQEGMEATYIGSGPTIEAEWSRLATYTASIRSAQTGSRPSGPACLHTCLPARTYALHTGTLSASISSEWIILLPAVTHAALTCTLDLSATPLDGSVNRRARRAT
jgi:hypothetical protein